MAGQLGKNNQATECGARGRAGSPVPTPTVMLHAALRHSIRLPWGLTVPQGPLWCGGRMCESPLSRRSVLGTVRPCFKTKGTLTVCRLLVRLCRRKSLRGPQTSPKSSHQKSQWAAPRGPLLVVVAYVPPVDDTFITPGAFVAKAMTIERV